MRLLSTAMSPLSISQDVKSSGTIKTMARQAQTGNDTDRLACWIVHISSIS